MNYVTPQQLVENPGVRELSQVASDEHHPLVLYDLLELTLLNEDRSEFSPEDIALADQALQRINDAVQDAEGLINGYLVQRGYSLPLAPAHRLVKVWCRAIARYYLHRHRVSLESNDPIVRDYRDALKLLQQVADGKLSLGAEDDLASSSAGPVLVKQGLSTMRNALKDY